MTDTVKVEQWSYPFKVKGGEGQPSKAVTNPQQYYDALAKAESGYYPIGRNGLWHGGVHFDKGTANLLDQTAVHCIADGEVIAYRIDSRYPTATFSSGVKTYSKGFVLVRHRLEAPKPPALAGTVTPATPPAPQPSLIFYSLYMHLLDWEGYGNPGAPTPPDFFGETVYSVKPEKAIDPTIGLRVREGPANTFAVRALLAKGTKVRLGDVGGPTHKWRKLVSILEGSALPSLTLDDNCWVFPGEMESTVNPDEFLVGEKANDPEPTLAPGKGFNVRKTGNGQTNDPKTGLIPVGTTFTLEPGTGNRRKLKAFVSGQDITPLSANSVQNIQGFVYVPDLQTSRTEPKKDEVFVLERPYAIKAGALVGHPGCYQNHDDAVASPLVHLEIFCCEDLPAFIAKSKAAALGLPTEQKTLLKVYKGASKLIAHRADINASNPPKVTDEGIVVGVDMILSLGMLDSLPADHKITISETVPGSTTPKITQWWRLDGLFADVNGNPIGGWLTEQSEMTTRHSPWEWEGFDFISETVCNADNLACHLDMTGTLDESERADYSSRIDMADNGPVKTRLYDIIDGADGSIRDNKLTPQEISAALAKPWHAQSIARLATHYESEWLWKEDKWNELDTLMAPDGEPNANWVEEKRRIKELAWWKTVYPESDGKVWHLNAAALIGNFSFSGCVCKNELTKAQLRAIAPHASSANVDRYIDPINEMFEKFKIDQCISRAHVLAQMLHESGSMNFVTEGLDSNDPLPAYHPYIGRGLLQITWESNYRAYGNYVGENFIGHPNYLKIAQPPHCVVSVGWFWSEFKKLSRYSDKDDFIYVTILINGGFNGYDHRLSFINTAIEQLKISSCAKLNTGGIYKFEESEAYNKAKPSFAWGLWSDPGSSAAGKTKNKQHAIAGYSRYIEIYNSTQSVRDDTSTKYYASTRRALQAKEYAEQRIEILRNF